MRKIPCFVIDHVPPPARVAADPEAETLPVDPWADELEAEAFINANPHRWADGALAALAMVVIALVVFIR